MALRIVLTGGPGAGKTVVCARLAAESGGRWVHVPEAASHVYALLETRWDRLDDEGRRAVQRQIYQTQLRHDGGAGEPGGAGSGVPAGPRLGGRGGLLARRGRRLLGITGDHARGRIAAL